MVTESRGLPRRASRRPRISREDAYLIYCKIALVQVKNSAWFIIIMLLTISRIHIYICIYIYMCVCVYNNIYRASFAAISRHDRRAYRVHLSL